MSQPAAAACRQRGSREPPSLASKECRAYRFDQPPCGGDAWQPRSAMGISMQPGHACPFAAAAPWGRDSPSVGRSVVHRLVSPPSQALVDHARCERHRRSRGLLGSSRLAVRADLRRRLPCRGASAHAAGLAPARRTAADRLVRGRRPRPAVVVRGLASTLRSPRHRRGPDRDRRVDATAAVGSASISRARIRTFERGSSAPPRSW